MLRLKWYWLAELLMFGVDRRESKDTLRVVCVDSQWLENSRMPTLTFGVTLIYLAWTMTVDNQLYANMP